MTTATKAPYLVHEFDIKPVRATYPAQLDLVATKSRTVVQRKVRGL